MDAPLDKSRPPKCEDGIRHADGSVMHVIVSTGSICQCGLDKGGRYAARHSNAQ